MNTQVCHDNLNDVQKFIKYQDNAFQNNPNTLRVHRHEPDHILSWVGAFMEDRKSQNMSKGTLYFYQAKLGLFTGFCESQSISQITQIDANLIRQYLLHLKSKGHNPGGCHQGYRTLKTFLLWWEREAEPEEWKNPIRKVKAPKLSVEPLDPVELATVQKLIDACKDSSLMVIRDMALLYFLLDTGARAAEVCALDVGDIDQVSGSVLIRSGKGGKPRIVCLGQKAMLAIRLYLRTIPEDGPAWLTDEGGRLSYWGLNEIIRRRAAAAGVDKPELHDFRRAFAINFLRNGGDIFTLQQLMGHADLQVMRRYLKQTDQDLITAHAKVGPVDHSSLGGVNNNVGSGNFPLQPAGDMAIFLRVLAKLQANPTMLQSNLHA